MPHLLKLSPIHAHTPTLPDGEVVEVDASLEEKFVLEGDAFAFELLACF